MPKPIFKFLIILLTSALFTGCQAPATRTTSGDELLLEEARTELAQARNSLSPARELHQLAAADYFYRGGDRHTARSVLNSINEDVLPLQSLADYSLLSSTLALEDDNFFTAQRLLTLPQLERHWRKLTESSQRQWLQLRADLFALLGREQQSIENYVLLASISDSEQRQYAHDRIWFLLTYLPQNTLQQFAEHADNDITRGWYELALQNRASHGDIRQLQQNLADWRRRWSQHPASATLPQGLAAISALSPMQLAKVALLLPDNGSLSKAGEVIQQGFLTAWYDLLERYGEAGEILFYDTSDQQDITTTYQAALAAGAEIIIGPLDKTKVQQLLNLETLEVPTLALNYLEDTTAQPPPQLFQLGLSVTDEAKQIVDRAWLEGKRHALAITPQTKWGEQALAAFREEWEARGGILEVTEPYQAGQHDFSPLLTQPLHIDYSEQRLQRLQQILGKRLSSMPRRRQDLDMVFMVAYPQHARQIKPTLDFLFAGDLPIYATSHIYNGIPDPGRNRDLDGIKFSAMPWVLPGALSDRFKPDDSIPPAYRQLFALGLDAFQLHQWLTQIEQLPGARLFGSTGTLSLNDQRVIHREQPWGIFSGGRVKAAPIMVEDSVTED